MKQINNNSTRFIHISDTHIGADKKFKVMGVNPYVYAERLVDLLCSLPFTADFIVHTGDVVHEIPNAANEQAYMLMAELMQRVRTPIYYVTGNHDTSAPIKKLLTMGMKEELSDTLNTYRFDIAGTRFLTIDARGPDEIDPHGLVSSEQMHIVQSEIEKGTLPLVIFVHYPPVSLDSPWLDRDMLIQNGDELHSLLVRAKDRLRGVFFGHVHRPISIWRDSILYASTGSPCVQFYSYPEQDPEQKQTLFQKDGTTIFNIITIARNNVIVKSQSLRRATAFS